jgi:hypothetical protein
LVPEPVKHPYGIIIYAEIQIDATEAGTGRKRNLVDRRLVLLERQSADNWKIVALSKVRL